MPPAQRTAADEQADKLDAMMELTLQHLQQRTVRSLSPALSPHTYAVAVCVRVMGTQQHGAYLHGTCRRLIPCNSVQLGDLVMDGPKLPRLRV